MSAGVRLVLLASALQLIDLALAAPPGSDRGHAPARLLFRGHERTCGGRLEKEGNGFSL
jgi:hypothetical protein